MARICFIILNHTSATISAITFSKSLVEAGHQVTLLGNDASCKRAKENGLQAISYGSFTDRSAPTGFKIAINDKFKHWLPPSKEYLDNQNEVLKKLTQIQLQEKFDLAIIDTMVIYPYIISSIRAGIPVIRFTPNLSSSTNKYYPAISSTVTPRTLNLSYKLNARLSKWQRYASVIPTLAFSRIAPFFDRRINHHQTWQRQIKAAGLQLYLFEYGIGVKNIPELVAAPTEFEFPLLRNIQPKRNYIGACVDADRDLETNPILDSFDERPLIYCALGTFSTRYAHARDVFDTMISFAKKNKEYNYLIQFGDVNLKIEASPNHIQIERFVPQVGALRKAKLMVTHGGLGSVREASFFGVPMIVIPGWNDQYGNAARIDYHGTGILLKPKEFTLNRLTEIIPTLIENPETQKRVLEMKKAFQYQQNMQKGIEMIEAFLLKNNPKPQQ